jgi:hypothetical protein
MTMGLPTILRPVLFKAAPTLNRSIFLLFATIKEKSPDLCSIRQSADEKLKESLLSDSRVLTGSPKESGFVLKRLLLVFNGYKMLEFNSRQKIK